MGLPAIWIRVAEAIGFDAFLAMWRVLDAEPSVISEQGHLELRLRRFKCYLRYQRNRYIEALAAMGLSWREIKHRLQVELCETLSRRHITDLMRGK